MRDYKFRGKRTDNGEWVEGCYAEFINYLDGNSKPGIQVIRQVPSDFDRMVPAWETELVEVIAATVGQYTGLNDKTDKRIFEGDICRDSLGWIFVVVWDSDNGRFLGRHSKPRGDTYVCYVGREPAIEIVGNIHDNPEGGPDDADK